MPVRLMIRRKRSRLALAALCCAILAGGTSARASCNLIPVAETFTPSILGEVSSPIVAPGGKVEIRLTDRCDSASPGFDVAHPENNQVKIRFEPPGGASTEVAVAASLVTVVSTNRLTFAMPDTDGLLSGGGDRKGFTGPARIWVKSPDGTTLAQIGELHRPTSKCDAQADPVFEQFTVLPEANRIEELVGASEIRATVDGGGNLLVPFDYTAVLPLGPGSSVARLLAGRSDVEAFSGSGQPISIPGQEFIRSFTLDGRPLPPLLRVDASGENLFGTADAVTSVLRIARRSAILHECSATPKPCFFDDQCPSGESCVTATCRQGSNHGALCDDDLDCPDGECGPALFDLSDRLSSGGQGPILLSRPANSVQLGPPVPLEGLRSTAEIVAFAGQESVPGIGDMNSDGDEDDFVAHVVQVSTGAVVPLGRAVSLVGSAHFSVPAIEVGGSLTAFLEDERAQGKTDLDGDGDALDSVLRVFDAAGSDLIPALDVPAARARLLNDRSLAVSGDYVFFREPAGELAFVEAVLADFGDGNVLAMSPDGAHLYAPGDIDGGPAPIAIFSRDEASGAVTLESLLATGQGDIPPLESAAGVAVSGDGAHVYVSDQGSLEDLMAFSRDAETGALTFIESHVIDLVPGIDLIRSIAISPDGLNVYVQAAAAGRVVVFARNPATGGLTQVQTTDAGVMATCGGIALSPDGAFVYATAPSDDAVVVFARDPSDGRLGFEQTVTNQPGGPTGPTGMFEPQRIGLSRDGNHVYVTALTGNSITSFSRDSLTGELAFADEEIQGVPGDMGLIAPNGVAVHPDGNRVYVAGGSGTKRGVAIFARDGATGALTFLESELEGSGSIGGVVALREMLFSPDGANFYQIGESNQTIAVYAAADRLAKLHVPTKTWEIVPEGLSTNVRVADERAVLLVPEGNGGGVDSNGDGDPGDRVAHLYEASTGTLTSLATAANRQAISPTLVALTVPERDQQDTDLNGDGDPADDVLAVYEIGTPPVPVNLGIAADAVAIDGTVVVFSVPESQQGMTDLNHDGDTTDRVLHLYRHGSPSTFSSLDLAVEDFVVGGNSLLAFRTSEAAQNNTDLNGDGDTLDTVMHVYDLVTGELFQTGQAAIRCALPGCDPFLPYKVQGDTVAFLTREADQGNAHLNGDDDSLDTVVQLFNVRSRKTQPVELGGGCGSVKVSPFPEVMVDGTALKVPVRESDVGKDIDGDGDLDDCVMVVAGDQDEDGTLDDFDTCSDTANAEQVDTDGDGLGDGTSGACDDRVSGCLQTPSSGCRVPTLPGRSSLTLVDKLSDSADQFTWVWRQGQATALADYGDPTDTEQFFVCMYAGSRLVFSADAPAASMCGKKRTRPCWKALPNGKGFAYRDTDKTPDGLGALTLKVGADGRTTIVVKGKGADLPMPALDGLASPLTVQLQSSSSRCWEATYAHPLQQTSTVLKALSD